VHRIGIFVFPNVTALDVVGPHEVFSRLPGCEVELIAASGAPVLSDKGLLFSPTRTHGTASACDLICMPGGPGISDVLQDREVLGHLVRMAGSARWVTSVCTGALALGAAGLLRGYRATTHWRYLDLLPLFGAQPVKARVVVDADRITAAGVSAGIDFALTVAARTSGEAVARRIQLSMEYDPQPPFDSGSPASARRGDVESVTEATAALFETRRRILERLGEQPEAPRVS